MAKAWLTSPLARRYSSNTGWMLASRGAWILSAATIGIYVARQLGPSNFGILNYAIAFTGLFSIIGTVGVEDIVTRQLLQTPNQRDRLLGNLFLLRTVLLTLMGAALGLTLWQIHATPQVKILCVIIALGYGGILFQSGGLYFQATVQSKYIAIPSLISCIIGSILRLFAAYHQWPLEVFAAAEAGNLLLHHLGCLLFYWKRVDSPWRWNWNWTETRELLKSALPLTLKSVFIIVYIRTNQLMLEYFLDSSAVGYFALASRIMENLAIAATMLCISFFPAVVTAALISKEAYHKQLHRLYFLVFWTMAAAATLTTLIARLFISTLFGQAFLPAVPVLRLFIWTLLGTALLSVFSQWAINEKRLSWIAWGFGSGVVINILLNLLLIPRIGINGAAWSSLIAMPLGLILTLGSQPVGRDHLRMMLRSVFTLPSFRLGEHPAPSPPNSPN